ncbi:hypothetical protein [Parafilimonas sp.]|uniref:hypothetical protein n=1 Tax=Parafilimonas sp. TaxID=1969739 RepID=UPI0039E64EF6
MRKRISVLPLTALLLGVFAAFAFKPAPRSIGKATHADYFWYRLTDGGNKNHASDYTRVGTMEPDCDSGPNVCAVHAQDNGSSHPLGIPASGAVTTNSFIDQVDSRTTP